MSAGFLIKNKKLLAYSFCALVKDPVRKFGEIWQRDFSVMPQNENAMYYPNIFTIIVAFLLFLWDNRKKERKGRMSLGFLNYVINLLNIKL